ncbi:MAG: putative small integral membrane protein [Crocinitomicaceae bacterium]|jgi:predicted small integral membrane protein
MYSTALLFRIAKVVSIFAIGMMTLIVVVGNLTDYYTNYHFVEHVLKMDTTFPDANIHYRSIDSPLVVHAGYIFIITLETMMAFCCLKGSWILFRKIKSDALTFHANKKWSIAGLIIGIIIWFFGFEVVGGEWFSMWQSSTWNGLGSADRIVTFVVLILILLQFKDEEL